MAIEPEKQTILTTKLRVRPDSTSNFVDWQSKLNMIIARFSGFISLEILSSKELGNRLWTIVQRFNRPEQVLAWRVSKERLQLMDELKPLLTDDSNACEEKESGISDLQGGVTEVFVTHVSHDKEEAFREWLAKIHRVEAKYPGFRGMYVQPPSKGKSQNWITLLQFDTSDNLNRWLSSSERQAVLVESNNLVSGLESHRIVSPYAGWFASLDPCGKNALPLWKQTMIILLVLFPIVMLEMKFLSPFTKGLNVALSMFISNAISVSLISWPAMPIAIYFLKWWLSPKSTELNGANIMGTIIVITLYLLEITLFWNFL